MKKPENDLLQILDEFCMENETTPQPHKKGLEDLNELIGLHRVKAEIHRQIDYQLFMQQRKENGLPVTPRLMNFIFEGAPGTGKTTVARILGRILYEEGLLQNDIIVETNREGLTDIMIGGSEKATKSLIDKAMGGILFIDEAYSLVSDTTDGRDFGLRVIDTLMPYLDPQYPLCVIMAGYPQEMKKLFKVNPGLISRFPIRLEFDDYTAEELYQIIRSYMKENRYTATKDAEKKLKDLLTKAVSIKNFGNGRFIHTLLDNHIIPAVASRCISTRKKALTKKVLSTITAADIPVIEQVLDLSSTQSHIGFR